MKKLRQTNITIEERKDKFGQTTSFRVRYFENSHRCSQSFKDRVSAESFVNCIKSARAIPSDIKFSVAGLVHQARFQEVCASLKLEVPAAYDECISYLTAKYSVTNPGMLLHNAISKFMITREKTKCRDRTITEYNQYLNKLENSFGAECPLCNIKGENLKSLLEAISSPSVKRNYLKILKAFFNYAAKNGWIKENPTTNIAIEHIKVDEMPPAILSVERTKSFFEKLPPNPVVQISFALLAFAGLRPEEVCPKSTTKQRLAWENINFRTHEITVTGATSKIRRLRVLSGLPDNLWKFLELVPAEQRKGKVCTYSHATMIRYRRTYLGKAEQDIFRHSFGTYGYYHLDPKQVVEIMGHLRGFKTFDKFYKGQANKESAAEYFSIVPKMEGSTKSQTEEK